MPSGVSPFPFLQVQVAFASNPLSGVYSWSDISASCQNVNIQRGRQHVLSSFEPGRLTVLLDGRDGTFDPTNSSSTYYPNVTINRRVQVLAWWNMLSATDGASIPTGQTLYNCTASANGQLTAQAAGNMVSSSASGTAGFPVTPGATYFHQELVQANTTTRACFATLWFYNSAGAWVASSSGAQVTDSASATVTLTASASAPPTARYGSTGTTILSAASSEKHTNTQPQVAMASSAGTWYAGGGVPIFTGFVDAWTPQYKDNLSTDIQMTATDGLRLLAQAQFTQASLVPIALADGATGIWLLNDPAGSVSAADSAGANPGVYTGSSLQGVAGPELGGTATTFYYSGIQGDAGRGWVNLPITSRLNTTGAFSIEAWLKVPSASSDSTNPFRQDVPARVGSSPLIQFGTQAYSVSSPGAPIFTVQDSNGNNLTASGTTTLCDGNWHQLLGVRDATGKVVTLYADGAWVASSSGASALNPDVGAGGLLLIGASQYSTNITQTVAQVCLYSGVALTAAQVLTHYNAGSSGLPQTDSVTYMQNVLSLATWPSVDQSLGTAGQSTIPAPTLTLSGTSVLSYMQSVAKAENGALFVNGSGQVVFQNRYTIVTGPNNVSVATFGDDINNSAEIKYARKPTVALDNIDLYNISIVTRSGGTAQTASSVTSIASYGASSSPLMSSTLVESGLLITTDAESLARAQWNVGHYATPLTRVRGLTINVLADPTNMFPLTVFRELRDRITVNRRPYTKASGWPTAQFSQDSYIEGITHNIDAQSRTWTVDIACSPAETQSYWILNDTTYSNLDSTTRLAY